MKSIAFSKGHKLQISENRGLRKIFGLKKDVSEQFRV
jgi:hypothetical protein